MKELGVEFKEDPYDWFMGFAGKDPHHITSTLQDIYRGKRTETSFFNGFISEKGRKFNIKTPANDSIMKLMEIIEKSMNL